jgi:hypothetical protein
MRVELNLGVELGLLNAGQDDIAGHLRRIRLTGWTLVDGEQAVVRLKGREWERIVMACRAKALDRLVNDVLEWPGRQGWLDIDLVRDAVVAREKASVLSRTNDLVKDPELGIRQLASRLSVMTADHKLLRRLRNWVAIQDKSIGQGIAIDRTHPIAAADESSGDRSESVKLLVSYNSSGGQVWHRARSELGQWKVRRNELGGGGRQRSGAKEWVGMNRTRTSAMRRTDQRLGI